MTVSEPPIFQAKARRAAAIDRPEEQAFRALVRTIGLLDRVMQPYFARFGISGSQWAALRALHRAEFDNEVSLRITDLSERLLIRPPSVSGVIGRLERGGLVSRGAGPRDLRTRRVRLTPRGRRVVEQVIAVYAQQMDCVLGVLNASDQQELRRLLERLSGHLERLLGELPTAPAWAAGAAEKHI